MPDLEELQNRVAALEKRFRKLEDIESIRQVRYAYWRFVREAQYDELVALFSINASVDLGPFGLQAEGRQAIGELYQSFVAPASPAGMNFPRGFIPEIEITAEDTARAIWLGEAPIINPDAETVTSRGFLYNEEYLREGGQWKISSLKISFTFTTEIKMMPVPKKTN